MPPSLTTLPALFSSFSALSVGSAGAGVQYCAVFTGCSQKDRTVPYLLGGRGLADCWACGQDIPTQLVVVIRATHVCIMHRPDGWLAEEGWDGLGSSHSYVLSTEKVLGRVAAL